jgi:prolyl-tRNA synthetase
MAVSPFGEDSVVTCGKCKYAANRERAECAPSRSGFSGEDTQQILPVQEIPTPGAHTIEQVSATLQVQPRQIVKTLIYRRGRVHRRARPGRPRGERGEAAARRAGGDAGARDAGGDPAETGGPIGFSGPVGLKLRIFADYAAIQVCNAVAGANKADTHLTNVNVEPRLPARAGRRPPDGRDGRPLPALRRALGFTPASRWATSSSWARATRRR